MSSSSRSISFAGLLVAAGLAAPASADDGARVSTAPVVRTDEIVSGGPQDFMVVRHVVLAGSDFEIGKALATIAKERYGAAPLASSDAVRTRAQRRFVKEHFPALLERMRGAAAGFHVDLENDRFDLNGISDPCRARPGCSAVFFPPQFVTTGAGVLSRNYEFTTGAFDGTAPGPGALGATARPMVLELHPTGGHASLSLCAYDLLGGVIDGVNDAGLTVALLAMDEQFQKKAVELEGPPQVGFGVLSMLRLLLDTCTDVDEAKQALLTTKQVYEVIPCHYIVADAKGRSFVWERSFGGNFDYLFDGAGLPQVVTNYAIHQHPEVTDPSGPSGATAAPLAKSVCPRARRLVEGIRDHAAPFTLDEIIQLHACVAQVPPAVPVRPDGVTHRTLWHALYVPEERRLEIDFYLRDEPDPAAPGQTKVVRSGYLDFTLEDLN